MLNRANIAAPMRRSRSIAIAAPPFNGGEVAARSLSMGEWIACEEAAAGARSARLFPHLLAAAIVDVDGLPVWTAEDWDVWAAQNTAAFGDVLQAALEVNGRAGEDTQKNG